MACPVLPISQLFLCLPHPLSSPHFPVQVIYGDTDSVMIYTATDDVREARDLGARIKREVGCVARGGGLREARDLGARIKREVCVGEGRKGG